MLALAEAWLHPFPSPWRLHWQQQQEAVLRTPAGSRLAAPVQSPAERRLVEGSSVTMICQLSRGTIVHWYRQLPGEPPKRILYMSGYSPTFDDSNDSQKFQVQRNASDTVLIIKKTTRRDTGTYYCAYWYRQAFTALDGHR
uniref:Ig-like domain-containing protein n=1 Tax=Gallus gallus TaxID=9031 RepID=A0A8V0Z3C7_CHICK